MADRTMRLAACGTCRELHDIRDLVEKENEVSVCKDCYKKYGFGAPPITKKAVDFTALFKSICGDDVYVTQKDNKLKLDGCLTANQLRVLSNALDLANLLN